jgi:hypothetical protein
MKVASDVFFKKKNRNTPNSFSKSFYERKSNGSKETDSTKEKKGPRKIREFIQNLQG